MAENDSVQWPAWYLESIENTVFKRMDSTENGGNGDGKVNVTEAVNDLHIDILFRGLEEGSQTYNKLKGYTEGIENVLQEYAGEDGEFSAEEWASFLNGKEWNQVIETFHNESPYYQQIRQRAQAIEEERNASPSTGKSAGQLYFEILGQLFEIGKSKEYGEKVYELTNKYCGLDGMFSEAELAALKSDPEYITIASIIKKEWDDSEDTGIDVGKLKVAIFNSLRASGQYASTVEIEELIDKYARNGKFTKNEYKALNEDPTYAKFMQKYNLVIKF